MASLDKIEIVYSEESLIPSFRQTLDSVAREKVYIEMIEAPTLDQVLIFQKAMISQNLPSYFAVLNDEVVGWADISVGQNPRLNHRGHLGMGLLRNFRGRGLGTRLLTRALDHARELDLLKVELQVYATNSAAIALYTKLGFEQEGLSKGYRRLDGQMYDCLYMGKFLNLS